MKVTTQINRIYFLDYLRGLAVLLVIWGHIFLVGINDPKTVGIWIPTVKNFIFGEDSVNQNVHGQIGLIVALKTGVTSGPLGVAIFFLISGFVILKTVDYSRPWNFLVRRFFRIIPLCGVAVLATALVTAAYCAANNVDQPNSISSVLTSTFVMNYYNGAFATIPVLWTLEVEIAFYLIISLVALMVGRIGFKAISLIALLCIFYIILIGTPFVTGIASPMILDRLIHLGSLIVHINFMLVGSIIYRGFSDKRPGMALIVGTFVFISYIACFNIFQIVSKGRNIGVALPDVSLALVIFLIAFLTGMRGPKFSLLQWIGKISYPLYLVHVPLGWGVLALLGGIGWDMNSAALTSVFLVTFVAWILHVNVELPAQNMGKKIANYFWQNSYVVARTEQTQP